MAIPRSAPPAWLEEFRRELAAGLASQSCTDPVEVFVISREPRILALVVEPAGRPAEGTLRDIDHAMALDTGATLATVALDIAVGDIAEPGSPGVALAVPELEEVTRRWPGIRWSGDVDLLGGK